MTRKSNQFRKRDVKSPPAPGDACPAPSGADAYDKHYRPLLLFALIGGLPFHFLIFPFGIFAQSVLFGPACWLRVSLMASHRRPMPMPLGYKWGAYFIFFFVGPLFAYYLPNFLSSNAVEGLSYWLKSLLSFTPFADGMWHKLSFYEQSYSGVYHQTYLFYAFFLMLYSPCIWLLLFRFSSRSDEVTRDENSSLRASENEGDGESLTLWMAICVLLALVCAAFFDLQNEFMSKQFVGNEGRIGPLFPENPIRSFRVDLVFYPIIIFAILHLVPLIVWAIVSAFLGISGSSRLRKNNG